ncbi:hypothetical protein FJT64_024505 [Amphibalanus amphitrite]|uniref:Zinc finger BED domain-containing protein 4 n=1 Tax=Amphibalanus amphitrite TaxID=1232801 RepID=A0A6A4WAC6_AMPAM|nr:hypothetical protein FJT64_024505 [Amphibalanus amphitrite]
MKKDSTEDLAITRSLVKMIAENYKSLSLVESESFRQFIHELNPRCPVPGRRFVRQQLLSLAEGKKAALKKSLLLLPKDTTVCLTMDLWSSRKLIAFLGMTVHFVALEPEAKLESQLLAFK